MNKNKVNISHIAKELDMSPSTVSRALSGSGRISDDTRKKINGYLERNGLIPNTREKRYTDIVTKMISVVLPGESDFAKIPYFSNVLYSVYDYFSIRGYQINFIKIKPDDISNLKTAVADHVMDGVILTRTVENDDEIQFLKEQGVPFVIIGPSDDPSLLSVDSDNEAASCDITMALIHKGLNKMAVMCAEREHKVNQIRLAGIMRAHMQSHMYLDKSLIFYDTESEVVSEMAVEKCLAAKVECILCMDDNICIGIIRALKKMEVKVPEDIRIASLHYSKQLEAYEPSISCIYQDDSELGREASRILYTYLNEGKKLPHMMVGYEMQIKDSTNFNS